MTYFEDQWEGWNDNGCQGEVTDMNPYEFWADRASDCESKGHGEIKTQTIEDDKGKKYKAKVCQTCNVILEIKKKKKLKK